MEAYLCLGKYHSSIDDIVMGVHYVSFMLMVAPSLCVSMYSCDGKWKMETMSNDRLCNLQHCDGGERIMYCRKHNSDIYSIPIDGSLLKWNIYWWHCLEKLMPNDIILIYRKGRSTPSSDLDDIMVRLALSHVMKQPPTSEPCIQTEAWLSWWQDSVGDFQQWQCVFYMQWKWCGRLENLVVRLPIVLQFPNISLVCKPPPCSIILLLLSALLRRGVACFAFSDSVWRDEMFGNHSPRQSIPPILCIIALCVFPSDFPIIRWGAYSVQWEEA